MTLGKVSLYKLYRFGKILTRFHTSYGEHCLETKQSPKQGFQKEHVSLEHDATTALSVGLETFSTLNIQQYMLHVKI